jgi:transcriptional regulator with XRE-family HTH domain
MGFMSDEESRKRGPGKVESYTDDENVRLRELMTRLRTENGWTQDELGKQLEIAQQNAGALERGKNGFSRITANRLAKLAGFPHAEAFLMSGTTGESKGGKWARREEARRIVLEAGFDPDVVERFIAEHTAPAFAKEPVKWWLVELAHEEANAARRRGPRRP